MSDTRKDLYSAIFFFAFAVLLYTLSFGIKMSRADSIGPQFFPRMIAIAIGGLSIIHGIKSIQGLKATPDEKKANGGFPLNLPLVLTMVLLVGYFLLLGTVGFILLTMVYLFCQMYLLLPKGSFKEKRTLIVCAATSLVVPVAVYMLFYHGFQIFLPAGILG